MNILLVHNYYRSTSPSGENMAFEAEREMLRRQGHRVTEFLRHSDELQARGAAGRLLAALAIPWNPRAAAEMRRVTQQDAFDVVHVHNSFPLLSPAIFGAIAGPAARVLTLHNYRLFCPAAIPLRAGKVCTECIDRHDVLPALRHGCYRQSRLATLPLAASVELHRRIGTWSRNVDAFIALSDFQRQRMIAAGLAAERVHVKGNFQPESPPPVPWQQRRDAVVFVGRLGSEKGLAHLLAAWSQWGEAAPQLRVVGDGPLRAEVEAAAAACPARIALLGALPAAAARAEICRARLLVLPSICLEGFPMVVGEAFAAGTPAAVSALGPLPGIVSDGDNGIVFAPGDAAALLAALRALWSAPERLEALGRGARRTHEQCYTETRNHEQLLAIYTAAGATRRRSAT